ncbi:MAG: hypothetical protein ACHQ50_07765, partial [Fimbriimonadales bacterium]
MVWAAVLLPLTILFPNQKILDFDAKATAIGPLLERLSAQTGAKLKASPKIAQEIVFVRAKGVELKDLKARLAEALSAEWTRDGVTDVLTRTPAIEKQIWKSQVAYRRKLVEEALKDAQRRVALKFDAKALAIGLLAQGSGADSQSDPAAARRRFEAEKDLFSRGPMSRLLDRLVLACNPDDLAAVGPYERHIFKLNPTQMQRGIDRSKFEAAMAAFSVEQQAWIDEAAKVTFPDSQDGRMVSDPRSQLRNGTTLSGISLEVRRGEMTALFNANLTSEAAQPFGNTVLMQTMFADPARKFLDSQMTPAAANTEDPVVELSVDSREFQDRMSEAFMSRQPAALTPRMRGLMLGVESNDPLSWTVSDALSTYAESRKVNVVAALPDQALTIAFSVARQQPLRAGQFMRGLLDSGTVDLHEKDGWAVIVPGDRVEAALDFTPRAAVAELMKSVFAAGRLDIHDYARYAFQSKRLNRGGLGEYFLAMYDRSFLGASDRTDWKSLQLYGSFSPMEQRAMESGGRYPYSGMSPDQRTIVERIVYWYRLTRGQINADGEIASSNVWSVEPTDSFAMGVPSSCVVVAKAKSSPTIVAYGKGADGQIRPLRSLDAYTLATIEAEIVGNSDRMSQYGVAGLAGYAPGANSILTLRVEVTPGVWAQSDITVPDFDANAVPVPWDKLPDPYPKQIEAAI